MNINKIKLRLINIGLSAAIFILFSFCNINNGQQRIPKNDKQRMLVHFLQITLKFTHYSPKKIDDELSKEVFDNYIKKLDYFKLYFTESEYDKLRQSRTLLDDQFRDRELKFYNNSLVLFKQNIERAKRQIREIAEKPFDFSKDEYLITDYKNVGYSKDEKELKDRWRKMLKYATLIKISNQNELDIESKSEKKHTKKTANNKSWAELEAEKREEVLNSYLDNIKMKEYRTDMNWIAIYLNAFSEYFDPHSNYFPPEDKEKFDISISGTYEGIGARLVQRSGYIIVTEVMAGGPGYRQGELEVDDKILKVAQGDEKPIDVVGVNINDAIKLIKGKKKTVVKLTVKKIDGAIKVISIVRDVVEIEETFVKSSVIAKDGKKYGLIQVPKFYFDIKRSQLGRNGSEDVKNEIERLKKEGIEGLILDLRNNSGGSLDVAINMTGLFIGKGPIVQVKEKEKTPKIKHDTDSRVFWDKPMVVLVNELSASASEILAAALQDYKRAIIVGSEHTFGKGTVQGFLELGGRGLGIGFAKITMQKYYRINGGATQLKGVLSDIVLPTRYKYMEIGEEQQESAIIWDKIAPAKYNTWNIPLNIKAIRAQSDKRISQNKYFSLLDENAKYIKEKIDEYDSIPLNKKEYEQEQKQLEVDLEKFKDLKNYENNLTFISNAYEMLKEKTDTILKSNREAWHKILKKDAYIEESVNILENMENTSEAFAEKIK